MDTRGWGGDVDMDPVLSTAGSLDRDSVVDISGALCVNAINSRVGEVSTKRGEQVWSKLNGFWVLRNSKATTPVEFYPRETQRVARLEVPWRQPANLLEKG